MQTACEAVEAKLEAHDQRLKKLQDEFDDLNSYIRNPSCGSPFNPCPSCKSVDGDESS